jgi:hypothetical protein
MDWRLPEAKQRLPELIDAATEEPQLIYSQDQLVAAIVEPHLFQEFLQWRLQHRSLGDDFAEFRRICEEENYTLEIPPRVDRANPFLEDDFSV